MTQEDTPARKIKVLIIDSDSVRISNRMTEFAKFGDFGEIRSGLGPDAIHAFPEDQTFDVCLTSSDHLLPKALHLLVKTARQHDPRMKIIVTEAPEEPERILQYLEAGAWAYVCRLASIDELANRIRSAVRGSIQFSPAVAGALVGRIQELSSRHTSGVSLVNGYAELTPREHEVLALIGQRMTNRQIAKELVLEVGTVKNHVHNLLKKLDVDNRYEAAAYSLSGPVTVHSGKY